MTKKIQSALISVFDKDGLDTLALAMKQQGIQIYSTGGTQTYLESIGITCIPVESVTEYPSILGGRVKTLHPKIFGGILGRRNLEEDVLQMKEYGIPAIDLVIVDLYPFEQTVASTKEEKLIIEKIDIGGPSMIRAAAKNFEHVCVIAAKEDYAKLENLINQQQGELNINQRKQFAAKAFEVVMKYDIAIADYFNREKAILRYGENPHQLASFTGKLSEIFTQLHGKELSYNNLVDADAAFQLIQEFKESTEHVFAIIKHTNVCGIASRATLHDAWKAALAGDPESAFGGVLICNSQVDKQTAEAISEIFFEILIADDYSEEALIILQQKKNRILLKNLKNQYQSIQRKSIFNGEITQDLDQGNYSSWIEKGGRESNDAEKDDLKFANLIAKHLKSNAIALVKNKQLIGKGCGQTSRIDALRQAIDKALQFEFNLQGAVLASDAFFPFDDCVKIAHAAAIEAFIQPGGSIRDKDSIEYCVSQNLVMVLTEMRHFKH
ncbi:MAG: bifunctional phosphoribosylaminoimidazolecarboxamide formyltransferase/IMP cyclohydrolase [Chitinophagaceae bacterium]|nr:bifunctional phosphoribosylaminoimidazolecarboxamide formyltransferase/IMP cyclohydrolase [Chitinophagaceae bacterium]